MKTLEMLREDRARFFTLPTFAMSQLNPREAVLLAMIIGIEMMPDTMLRRWSQDINYFEVRTTILNDTYSDKDIKESLKILQDENLIDYKWISDGEHLVVKLNSNEILARNAEMKKSRFLD